jgi:predicted ATPase
MLADSLGDLQISSRFVDQVADYTGGNPLFVREIREQLAREDRIRSGSVEPLDYSQIRLTMTRPLQETILWDFLSLSATQQTMLECATQVGRRFSAWAVSVIAAIPEDRVVGECEALSREPGVLQAAGMEQLSHGRCSECFKFRFGLYADVVATRVEPSARKDNQAVLAMERERLAKAG